MKSTTKSRADLGFTLIEVLVALAVAGGALVLVLSANGASLRKSVQARVEERLIRAAESKFAEWQLGAERAAEGPLAGFDRHRWDVRVAREELGTLQKLSRVSFTVTGPGGKLLEWTILRDAAEGAP
ncbi:MAG TPA: type II secretion system protein [Planctomycetota bacterium]|nr:type II secretion system protein [Planctomycetota bacterium]